jgi:hypothetical protein
MPTINISQIDDTLVIHFDTVGTRINAYTLASTLVSIADATKAANSSINLGYDIEVVVEGIGPGSFRAVLRTIYKQADNLFSAESAREITLAIVAAFIYEKACAVDHAVKVAVSTQEVVVESGRNKVVIPRQVYDGTRIAEQNPRFVRSVGKAFESIGSDDDVKGIGFVAQIDSPPPSFIISQDTIREVVIDVGNDPLTRSISEQCDLQIVKAILEQSTRKWEFMWRGVRISAPVLDAGFYGQFFAHTITIAPGDELKVRLSIKQSLDPRTGIYTNIAYEVSEVFQHVPRLRQADLPLSGR